MKLETNSRRKAGKFQNLCKLNNSYTANKSEKKSHGKLANILRQAVMKAQHTETHGMRQTQQQEESL